MANRRQWKASRWRERILRALRCDNPWKRCRELKDKLFRAGRKIDCLELANAHMKATMDDWNDLGGPPLMLICDGWSQKHADTYCITFRFEPRVVGFNYALSRQFIKLSRSSGSREFLEVAKMAKRRLCEQWAEEAERCFDEAIKTVELAHGRACMREL